MLYNNVNNSSWLQISLVSKTTLFCSPFVLQRNKEPSQHRNIMSYDEFHTQFLLLMQEESESMKQGTLETSVVQMGKS